MRVHLLIDTISINVEKRLEGHTRAMTSAAGGGCLSLGRGKGDSQFLFCMLLEEKEIFSQSIKETNYYLS